MNGIDGFQIDPEALLEVAMGLSNGDASKCKVESINNVIETLVIIAGIVKQTEPGALEEVLDARARRIQFSMLLDEFDCENDTQPVIDALSNGSRDDKIHAMVNLVMKIKGVSIRESCRIISDRYHLDFDSVNSRYHRAKRNR